MLIVLSALAVAMAQEQPANFACPNYPFCALPAAPAALPAIPGIERVYAAEQMIKAQQHYLVQPVLPQVPGLAAHQAAVHAVSDKTLILTEM